MDKKKILKDHLDFKRISTTSENKIKDIERYVAMFLNSNKKQLSKFEEKDIINFLNPLEYSIRTINDIKVYLKVFIKWHFPDYSLRFRNLDKICRGQKPPKAYSPDQMLSEKEIKKLVEGEKELSWKVYWIVFFHGGFRPSEALRLKWENVFFEKEGLIIKVHTKKNNKDFIKAFPVEVEHYLKEWKKYNSTDWLFPSPIKENTHCHVKTAYHRLRKLSQRVLKKKVGLYQIRHSFGTLKYNSGINDDIVAQQMGHTKNMKETYLNLDDDKIKANARKIWVKAKDLPPEEKHELKKRVEKITAQMTEDRKKMIRLMEMVIDLNDKLEKFKKSQ